MPVIAIVGLGYVGLPLAVAFGRLMPTIGYDLSAEEIENYHRNIGPSGTVSSADLRAAERLTFRTDAAELSKADFILVAVPTSIDLTRKPDFGPLLSASRDRLFLNVLNLDAIVF